MAQTKSTLTKKIRGRGIARPIEEIREEPELESQTPKSKKVSEIDLPEDPIALPIEEKPEEDGPETDSQDEAATEELTLDDEELNPFGDKWEQ